LIRFWIVFLTKVSFQVAVEVSSFLVTTIYSFVEVPILFKLILWVVFKRGLIVTAFKVEVQFVLLMFIVFSRPFSKLIELKFGVDFVTGFGVIVFLVRLLWTVFIINQKTSVKRPIGLVFLSMCFKLPVNQHVAQTFVLFILLSTNLKANYQCLNELQLTVNLVVVCSYQSMFDRITSFAILTLLCTIIITASASHWANLVFEVLLKKHPQ
jgi:hypothetical protein